MHAWGQIQRTVDYIEDHLGEELPPQELAALSPFYYQRLFCRLVRKPVAEYIKLRRMAKATEALHRENARILDIALSLGFASHGHFPGFLRKPLAWRRRSTAGTPSPSTA